MTPKKTTVKLGTRSSLLAVTQAEWVAGQLRRLAGVESSTVTITAIGDDTTVPLDRPGTPGVFVSTLRDALLAGEVDYVVHSFKDLPSAPCPGLTIAAVPVRANPLDVLVANHPGGLAGLPKDATVGTSSPRRRAALGRIRPDIHVAAIRGNVDTRLRKVADNKVTAVVMAAAGLDRLGRLKDTWTVLDPGQWLPAPAQGALAVECRSDDPLVDQLRLLDDRSTRLAVTAERAVLAGVNAACTTAVGALATWDDGTLVLAADLANHLGVKYARVTRRAHLPVQGDTADMLAASLGQQVAVELLSGVTTTPGDTARTAIAVIEPAAPAQPPAPDHSRPDVIRAYQGQRTRRRPVWFMRQAGRSLPEFRAAREGIGMLESCLNPDLAAELTCQPVRRHKVDAAIFFSDIMVPAKLAGVAVDILPGRGPVLAHPVRTADDVAALPHLDAAALAPILEGVRASVAQLGATPLIGFAGAPFTVASYLVEGESSRSFEHVKALMADDEATWHKLAAWVARTTETFLLAQIEAGVQAVQLFDSWVGALTADQYRRYAAPHSREVFSVVSEATSSGFPRVHFGTGTGHLLTEMYEVGATVMGVDALTDLGEAELALGGRVPLQGNIDPAKLSASWDELSHHVGDVLAAGTSAPGHVVNLGHGVPPNTDPDRLTRLVELIHAIPDPAAPAEPAPAEPAPAGPTPIATSQPAPIKVSEPAPAQPSQQPAAQVKAPAASASSVSQPSAPSPSQVSQPEVTQPSQPSAPSPSQVSQPDPPSASQPAAAGGDPSPAAPAEPGSDQTSQPGSTDVDQANPGGA